MACSIRTCSDCRLVIGAFDIRQSIDEQNNEAAIISWTYADSLHITMADGNTTIILSSFIARTSVLLNVLRYML